MESRTQIFMIAGVLVAAVVIVVLGVFLLGGSSNPTAAMTTTTPIVATDHIRGAATSTVSVIEYGDFECPACGQYEPIVEQLTKDYGSNVAFVFRNFPLVQIHANALAGAEAAEAAGLQGKYWEMHDLLFAKQAEWGSAPAAQVATDMSAYALSIGLNVAKFKADMASGAVSNKIQADIANGNAAQIDHTPTFFINLKEIPNPNYADFKSAIDHALAS